MEEITLEKLRYPIGKFSPPLQYTDEYLTEKINELEAFPVKLKLEAACLSDDQLDTPYREGGWTVRQVVHHCADSHMNCLMRIKLALTENNPIIKFYYEDRWGDMQDNIRMPIEPTITFLEGLHYRLCYLLRSLNGEQLERKFTHPEHNREFNVKEIIGLYAWHGKHHLAHITELKKLQNW